MNKSINNSKTSGPPYLLGLIGFIPLVGAFVGVALIFYGVLKYKDKWLTIIGASCIAFTIIAYSLLAYVGKHSSLSREGFHDMSQEQLNKLVKNIEFFKIQNGRYPNNLEELSKSDKDAVTADFIQVNQERINDQYNYKRVGEKYILFSSGEDGVPNTKDDFFPQILITDRSKIGLIRSK